MEEKLGRKKIFISINVFCKTVKIAALEWLLNAYGKKLKMYFLKIRVVQQ
jgi:hypothetical protein